MNGNWVWIGILIVLALIAIVLWLPLILGERRARKRLGPERYAEAKRRERAARRRG